MSRLVWFRNDLRVADNKALFYACQNFDETVLAIYIATPLQWEKHDVSQHQLNFINEHLHKLEEALSEIGIALSYKECTDFNDSLHYLHKFCQKNTVKEIFYNRQYELNEYNRDQKLLQTLDQKIRIHEFDDSVLLKPGSLLNSNNEMYKIFTPFKHAFIKKLSTIDVSCLPSPPVRKTGKRTAKNIFKTSSRITKTDDAFPIGEKYALDRLENFCKKAALKYAYDRDFPALNATSKISPYLAIGVLSPRQCFHALKTEHPHVLNPKNSAFSWLNELIWRDFYCHLMFEYPEICKHQPFIRWTEKIKWNQDPTQWQAWKSGQTGYPIVDAAMRQLNSTGWMHNRLRMITASFLVKDLLIDWRKGEQYFMRHLIDGDLASNNGGWQWAASTGTDAVPYFRIFNPTTQAKRFDIKGDFIRRWVPELKKVPGAYIHSPHAWMQQNGCSQSYPQPIVDHSFARKRALQAFRKAKET